MLRDSRQRTSKGVREKVVLFLFGITKVVKICNIGKRKSML